MIKTAREIFRSSRFVATNTRAGLIVQSLRTQSGKLLPLNHPQYAAYVSSMETAIDSDEGNALCKALIN